MGRNGAWVCSICNYRNFGFRADCRTESCEGTRPWGSKGPGSCSSDDSGNGNGSTKEIQALKDEVRRLKEGRKDSPKPGEDDAGGKSLQEQRDKIRSELQTLAGLTAVEDVIARKKAEEVALVVRIQAEEKPHIQLQELEERLEKTKRSIGILKDSTIPELEKTLGVARAELVEKEAEVVRMESQKERLFRGFDAAGGFRADAVKAMDHIKQLQGLLTGPAGEKFTPLLGGLLAEVERSVVQGTNDVKSEESASSASSGAAATAGSQPSQLPQGVSADMEFDEVDHEKLGKLLVDYVRAPAGFSADGPCGSDKRTAIHDLMREAYGRAAKKRGADLEHRIRPLSATRR